MPCARKVYDEVWFSFLHVWRTAISLNFHNKERKSFSRLEARKVTMAVNWSSQINKKSEKMPNSEFLSCVLSA